MTSVAGRENQSLNALRTAAAFVVVVGHVRDYLFVPRAAAGQGLAIQSGYALTSLGNGAVVVFFVLSGYFVGRSIITGEARGRWTWPDYLTRRFVRLWLVLVPAVALTAGVDRLGMAAFPLSDRYDADSTAVTHGGMADAVGNVLFLQTTVVPTFGSNGALWSLAYEATYYVLFPLVYISILRRRGWRRAVGAALAAVIVTAVNAQILVMFPLWLLGALVAMHEARIKRARPSRWLGPGRAIAGMSVLTAMVADSYLEGGPSRTTIATYAIAGATAVLVCLLLDDPRPRRLTLRRLLWAVSNYAHSSYSLYAIHVPLLLLFAVALHPTGNVRFLSPSPASWLLLLATTTALGVLGWIFARLTERNTEAVRRRLVRRLGRGTIAR